MEKQKIVNLLNDNNNETEKITTRKWYIINDQNFGQYGEVNENDATIKFETKVIKHNLCDYLDAYILVTGDVVNLSNNSRVDLKNCAPFNKCIVHISEEHLETAEELHLETAEELEIVMPMYNLLEFSDNYEKCSGSLYQFKRDEITENADILATNSLSFKYKSDLIGVTIDNNTHTMAGVKIAEPLKY